MSSREYVYIFQTIKVSADDEPVRVLEERFLPGSECTLDAAKAMFMMRFEDRMYSRKHGVLWPDAVRFLDERRNEVMRYTSWNYLRDVEARETGHSEAAYA